VRIRIDRDGGGFIREFRDRLAAHKKQEPKFEPKNN
jgi:hypothetical protein